jgi:hypothetical protein
MASNKISRWCLSKTSLGISRALKVALQQRKWLNSKYRRQQCRKQCSEALDE